jgi:hypothetical protein
MPRVTSQRTRQGLLIVGEGLDPFDPPEKWELYLPDGTAVDVAKDPSKMLYRGEWADDQAYVLNDVVQMNGNLYILLEESLPLGDPSPEDADTVWIPLGDDKMRFVGTWAPGAYRKDDVVLHDGKLYIADDDIYEVPFEFVASASDTDYAADTTLGIDVPAATQVGDLMVWASSVAGPGAYAKPVDGGWTTLSELGSTTDVSPPNRVAIYAKVAAAGDLGSTKHYDGSGANTSIAELLIFRGAALPSAADLEFLRAENHALGTPLDVAAGANPATTLTADKVLRVFLSYSQNFATDSGNTPQWEVGAAGGSNRFLMDSHQVMHLGSYWAAPADSGLPYFRNRSGEHKYTVRFALVLPSPTAFDSSAWTELSGGISLPAGGATGTYLTKASGADGDAGWTAPPHDLPVGGISGYLLGKASGADRDVAWVAVPHDLPLGGATGYMLVKASGADRDVAWSAVPRDLPVGGATGYLLAKASAADRDVTWVSPASGGTVPAGGATGKVLAKASATDYDTGWVDQTPRDVPVGGTTDQVLAKNSGADRDLKWLTPSSSGSVAAYIYLDEQFAVDHSGLYTLDAAGGSDVLTDGNITDGDGDVRHYIYVPNLSSGSFYHRNDGHDGNFRDVLVAIEVEWQNNTGGTPVFSFDFRQQSDRFIRVQSHGTNIHIYTTAPGAADSLRANTAATYPTGARGWIVGMVYGDQVSAFWSTQHPLFKFFAANMIQNAQTNFSLAGDGAFNTEANRTGRADRIRISTGSGGNANRQRVLRHIIVDLDKLPVI